MESEFREPTKAERDLLQRLLEAEFPGRDELVTLVQDIRVRPVDEVGSLELRSQRSGTAQVVKRIPVEAEAVDADGFSIHALLHVVNGRPVELEIFKDDGSCVKQMPPPSAFELIVLPPMPQQT
jgi:hypothetical protein